MEKNSCSRSRLSVISSSTTMPELKRAEPILTHIVAVNAQVGATLVGGGLHIGTDELPEHGQRPSCPRRGHAWCRRPG